MNRIGGAIGITVFVIASALAAAGLIAELLGYSSPKYDLFMVAAIFIFVTTALGGFIRWIRGDD